MRKKLFVGLVDAIVPLVMPKEGMTRAQLARRLGLKYSDATRALERLRQQRLVRRHIRGSQYVYTYQGAQDYIPLVTLRDTTWN
jgi:predicted transcriptional regulator